MLKFMGSLLLAGGATALGFLASGRLDRRVSTLRALLGGLELLEREISFRLTPMPELLERLATQTDPPVDELFAHCREGLDRLGEVSLGQLWREGLELLYLGEGERAVLAGLGDILGRYDSEGQQKALALTQSALERLLRDAGEERDRLGRVYRVAGTAAGAVLVILLV